MRLASGIKVRDNIRLVHKLGEGAMGEVWVAEHSGLGTHVAVKFIHAQLAQDEPQMLRRFRREANAAATIKSPHVVQTFDAGFTEDDTPFIVMELLEGQSLADRLASRGPLTLRETCEVVAQVARCLDTAHGLGIVHRDIKPDNIFLVDQDDGGMFAKVLDFGIAKMATVNDSAVRLTRDGNLVGSPAYMSREQIMDLGEVDQHADIWGLAVCAYEALTGHLPFDGPTIGLICVAIVQAAPRPPSAWGLPGLPREVDRFFERAFHVDRPRRYQSAKELAFSLLCAVPHDAGQEDRIVSALDQSGKFSIPAEFRFPDARAARVSITGDDSLDDPSYLAAARSSQGGRVPATASTTGPHLPIADAALASPVGPAAPLGPSLPAAERGLRQSFRKLGEARRRAQLAVGLLAFMVTLLVIVVVAVLWQGSDPPEMGAQPPPAPSVTEPEVAPPEASDPPAATATASAPPATATFAPRPGGTFVAPSRPPKPLRPEDELGF